MEYTDTWDYYFAWFSFFIMTSAQTLVMIGVSQKTPLICEEEHLAENLRYVYQFVN